MVDWTRRLVALASVAFVSACGGGDGDNRNLVETARADARFSTLVEAVVAADLAGTLSEPGPFTVFAPTKALSPPC